MTEEQHRQRHIELHRALDELMADFTACTGRLPSENNVMELVEWSYQQTISPTDPDALDVMELTAPR